MKGTTALQYTLDARIVFHPMINASDSFCGGGDGKQDEKEEKDTFRIKKWEWASERITFSILFLLFVLLRIRKQTMVAAIDGARTGRREN